MALFTRVEKLVRTELSVTAEVEEEGTGKSSGVYCTGKSCLNKSIDIFVEIVRLKSSIRM